MTSKLTIPINTKPQKNQPSHYPHNHKRIPLAINISTPTFPNLPLWPLPFPMTNPTSSTTILHFQNPFSTSKKQKHHHNQQQQDSLLLPGLPDHISQLCLSLVPPSTLYSVCNSWRKLLYSPSFPPYLSLYTLFVSQSNSIHLRSFDPISNIWHELPDPPLRFLHHHPSFISRKLPIQSVSVNGKLVVLAATADHFLPALTRPVLFDPVLNKWSDGPQLCSPRRWCATGASHGIVYVASGIGAHFSTAVARSVEKWDLGNNELTQINTHSSPCIKRVQQQKRREKYWKWEKLTSLKDGKFSREAIDAVGWKDRLCMVNVKGDAAKEGIIYDVKGDCWEDMPEGMLAGWRGPAAAMDEETIYVVDESKGSLKKYDHVMDAWVEVVESHEMLKGAQQVVAAEGKVCVLSSDGGRIVIVDVERPGRVWVVEGPLGLQAVSIHALPRLSRMNILSK